MATTTKVKTLTARAHQAEIKRLDRLNATRDEMRRVQLELFTKELKRAQKRKDYIPAFAYLPWDIFVRNLFLVSSQSGSGPLEYWLRHHHGWDKVASSLARGDALLDGVYKEIKASIITLTNTSANFVQVRLSHDIDEYHLFVVEPDYTLRHFALSHNQMVAETKANKGRPAHGTKAKNAAAGPDVEWRWSIENYMSSPVRTRFIKNYQVAASTPDSPCCA
jgi:hypothetical protein